MGTCDHEKLNPKNNYSGSKVRFREVVDWIDMEAVYSL